MATSGSSIDAVEVDTEPKVPKELEDGTASYILNEACASRIAASSLLDHTFGLPRFPNGQNLLPSVNHDTHGAVGVRWRVPGSERPVFVSVRTMTYCRPGSSDLVRNGEDLGARGGVEVAEGVVEACVSAGPDGGAAVLDLTSFWADSRARVDIRFYDIQRSYTVRIPPL